MIIDLDGDYTFITDDIIGDGFSPFYLTGSILNCECDDADDPGAGDDDAGGDGH